MYSAELNETHKMNAVVVIYMPLLSPRVIMSMTSSCMLKCRYLSDAVDTCR